MNKKSRAKTKENVKVKTLFLTPCICPNPLYPVKHPHSLVTFAVRVQCDSSLYVVKYQTIQAFD